MSYLATTDSAGRFRLASTPVDDKAAYVEFLDGRTVFATLAFNVTKPTLETGSVWLRDLRLVNSTSFTLKATVRGAGSPTLNYVIAPGAEASVFRANTGPTCTFNPTFTGGFTIPIEVLGTGGSVSATVDSNGVGKVRVAAGVLGLLRFFVYSTTAFNAGICWSPGGQIVPGLGGSADICVGTDGDGTGGTAE
jgi:hypothetical protein